MHLQVFRIPSKLIDNIPCEDTCRHPDLELRFNHTPNYQNQRTGYPKSCSNLLMHHPAHRIIITRVEVHIQKTAFALISSTSEGMRKRPAVRDHIYNPSVFGYTPQAIFSPPQSSSLPIHVITHKSNLVHSTPVLLTNYCALLRLYSG